MLYLHLLQNLKSNESSQQPCLIAPSNFEAQQYETIHRIDQAISPLLKSSEVDNADKAYKFKKW